MARRAVAVSLSALGVLCAYVAFASAATLPDGRAYEAVSAPAEGRAAQVFIPGAGSSYFSSSGDHGISTHRPFEVAMTGNRAVYAGDSPSAGGTGNGRAAAGNAFLGVRGSPGGWEESSIQPPERLQPAYQAFAGDLSVGILGSTVALAPGAPEGYEDLYVRALSDNPATYAPVYAGTPPNRLASSVSVGFNEALLYAGANAGSSGAPAASHTLFEANDLIVGGGGALESELDAEVKANIAEGEEGKFRRILYDHVGGTTDIVNVLPDGKADADASFGSFPLSAAGPPGLGHAISDDGSRIFWTDGVTHDLYVREDGGTPAAKTVEVDSAVPGCISCTGGGGRFLTASSDGARVFFTDENHLTSDSTAEAGEPDLYEYDLDSGQTVDLSVAGAGEHADVQGLVGSSEDGAYLYFVAKGVLTGNASGSGEAAAAGSENLYVRHDGTTKFIAALSAADGDEVVPFDGIGEEFESGDWQAATGYRTAQVSSDGRSLVFMSNRSLTGYDNEQTAFNPFKGEVRTTPLDEVFLYDAEAGQLRCVSCDPSGAPPTSTEFNSYRPTFGTPVGAFIPITKVNNYRDQPRVLSDSGDRVFFDSGEPLMPQDTNGWLSVYEWERSGAGSCRQAQGCTSLLSSGSDPESSYLIGASATGGDVFFVTRARLVSSARGEKDELYDAHECTSAAPCKSETTAPSCGSTSCQATPPEAPVFSSPASLTFNGAGNVPPPSPPAPIVCPKGSTNKAGKCVKKIVKCKKGFVKRKTRCVKKPKSGRARTPIGRGKSSHGK